MIAVVIYLAAIVAANLSVAYFGPAVVPLNGFLLIGLDLTLRDKLHDEWRGQQLALKMGALIFTGGAISYIVNVNAGVIAVASTTAFVLASLVDAYIYQRMTTARPTRTDDWPYYHPRFTKLEAVNGSNLAGAAVDSIVFPVMAFGLPILWPTILALFGAKVAGGFFWSLLIHAVSLRRRAA